ncbi:MAG: TetR/AcrR family transcriptional regulator [Candidatus Izemoplasmataceae bacterium]
MPKETFYNLPNAKQEAIIEAIQKTFLEKPMTKISISDVVRHADIPRGSFYQYFEDLEDMFSFLIDYSLKAFEVEVLNRVKNETIEFFDYLSMALEKDYAFFIQYPHHKIVNKFFSYSHSYTVDFNSYIKRRHQLYKEIISYLDTKNLSHICSDYVFNLYIQINQMKMQYIQKIMKSRLTLDQAKAEYSWFIKVFKQGVKELNHHE